MTWRRPSPSIASSWPRASGARPCGSIWSLSSRQRLSFAVYVQPFVDPSSLLRDPAAVYRDLGVPAHTAMYYGFVSNLGVLIWGSASFICLFIDFVLLRSTPTGLPRHLCWRPDV